MSEQRQINALLWICICINLFICIAIILLALLAIWTADLIPLTTSIAILAMVFATLGIWLTVRVIIRRERWAKWLSVAVSVLSIGISALLLFAIWLAGVAVRGMR